MATVLVVDDNATDRELLSTLLSHSGHRVLSAGMARPAIDMIRAEKPDLIMCDMLMPGMDGYEFAVALRTDPTIADTPIVFYSGSYDMGELERLGRACGAAHVLQKPQDPEVILQVISEVLDATADAHVLGASDEGHRQLLAERLLATTKELRRAEDRARVDELTGLPNRRGARDGLLRMLAHSSRFSQPLAVGLMDIDHFKAINDTLGHTAGDEALEHIGGLLTASLRAGDLVGRWGGEEFLLVLPGTGVEGAVNLCHRLRKSIAGRMLMGRRLTASFGVATYPEDGVGAEELVTAADHALYAAKADGRNTVAVSATAATAQKAVSRLGASR